jgi:hypothetical protein
VKFQSDDLSELESLGCPSCGERRNLFELLDACVSWVPGRRWLRGDCPGCDDAFWLDLEARGVAVGSPSEDGRFFAPAERIAQAGFGLQLGPAGLVLTLLHRSWVFGPER